MQSAFSHCQHWQTQLLSIIIWQKNQHKKSCGQLFEHEKMGVQICCFWTQIMTKTRFHPWFIPRIRVMCQIPDQELMCIPKEKMQDRILNMWWQVHLPKTKHTHCVINLANEDVDLVGAFDETWSIWHVSLTCLTFEFACSSICSFHETSEHESFFLRCCLLCLSLVCGRFSGGQLLSVNQMKITKRNLEQISHSIVTISHLPSSQPHLCELTDWQMLFEDLLT